MSRYPSNSHHRHYEPEPLVLTIKCDYCGYANSLSQPHIPLWWSQWRACRCEKCGRRLARSGPFGYLALLLRYGLAALRAAPGAAWHRLRQRSRRLRRSARRLVDS